MRPSAARPGEHLVLVDIQLRTVGPRFVENQHCHRPRLLVVPCGFLRGRIEDTRFQRRATLCSEIPHLVLDAEADPETNLAHATDFWLN
jgi:hypothetical protein